MSAALAPPPLLTAEEYARLPSDGGNTELVKGRVIRMPPNYPYHGYVCSRIVRFLDRFIEDHPLGRLFSNDSGVITQRNPDTVRGADIAFYSFNRLPPGEIPQTAYFDVVPELVVEVRSPTDRWQKILVKVGEYLSAGITAVLVLDPQTKSAQIYRDEGLPQTFGPDDTLTLPDVLPGFELVVRRVFE
jgi:Uma2 family endonuclease